MSLVSTIRYIVNHPLNKKHKFRAFCRFVKWQVNTIINPFPIIYPFTDKCKLIIKKGMTGATGNFYCGLHEFSEMGFLLQFLRKKDLFIDIGANIGSYTVLASSHVGANTISIEPVPSTFANLVSNISINQIQDIVVTLNIALGSKRGKIEFTSKLDTANHVVTDSDKETIIVKVESLDDVLSGYQVPILLKIDVEGFETEVIKGAKNTIIKDGLKAIIIELNGSGDRYGYSEFNIYDYLISAGFIPYFYDPFERKLIETKMFGTQNTIYIRDIDFVSGRLIMAEKIITQLGAF